MVHISLGAHSSTLHTLSLAPNTLQEGKTTKLLGLSIDDEVTRKAHITMVTGVAIYHLLSLTTEIIRCSFL